jgi:hypothetical protein
MVIKKPQQPGAHAIERSVPIHRMHVPDGHREVLRVMEVIRAGLTRLKAAHDILDLVF